MPKIILPVRPPKQMASFRLPVKTLSDLRALAGPEGSMADVIVLLVERASKK